MEKYGISADSDNTILNSEAEDVDTLQIVLKGIGNLSGIEAFTSLTSLDCRFNQLASLDVSANTALTDLDCGGNSLASLDVSSNTALTTLVCHNSQLRELDVSKNTALATLDCYNNQLRELDVSTNTVLTSLGCYINLLTELDISTNTALATLFCSNNQLTSLNLKNGSSSLNSLSASSNPNLTCIQVDDASNIPSSWVKDATAVYSEDCTTLSSEDFELSGISISPNPTTGILNITATEKAAYRLLNIRG